MQEIVKGGLYRHFKGMYYYVLDVATHSETSEQFVVYQKSVSYTHLTLPTTPYV